MERAAALAVVRKYSQKKITFRHLVSVGGVMQAPARHFGYFDENIAL